MQYADMPDVRLVHAAKAGDDAAFGELYRRYRQLVFRICMHRLSDYQLAEDATQETFVNVMARLGAFEGGDRISHYIARTAHFTARDQSTAPSRTDEVLHRTTEYADVADDRAANRFTTVDNRQTLATILSDLRDKERDLLVDHHMNGTPLRAIAKRLSSTAWSIAVQLHRARAAARRVADVRGLRVLVPIPLLARIRKWHGQHGPVAVEAAVALVAVATIVTLTNPSGDDPDPGRGVSVDAAEAVDWTAAADRAHGPDVAGVGAGQDLTAPTSDRTPTRWQPDAPTQTVRPVAPLPEATIPVLGRRAHQDAPDEPDHDVVIGPEEAEVARITVTDEPPLDGPLQLACDESSGTPAASCSHRGDESGDGPLLRDFTHRD